MARSDLRIVNPGDGSGPDVDPELVRLAHNLMSAVASGEVQGFAVFSDNGEEMAWGYAGEFDAYAFQTFMNRRMGELIDEMESEGDEC